jgi:hypothetical protein
MKYTIEQKKRLNGMDCYMDLKIKVAKEFGIAQRNFTFQGDYIVIQSKMNRNRHLRK